MQRILVFIVLISIFQCCANQENDANVKSLLLEQLKNTHTHQDWFVPTKKALEGLNYAKASWKDSTDNHSILEIVSHLIFWNERILKAFNQEDLPDFDNNNDKTFTMKNKSDWEYSVQKLDSLQTAWEHAIKNSTSQQRKGWTAEIANMAAHTAYHTGQIIYIRKQNGWWN